MSRIRSQAVLRGVAATFALALLGGCGIDQGGGRVTSASPEALVVVGPITGFGSVHVNGVALETAAAEILVDGNPVTESALKEGQIIRAVAAVTSVSSRAVSIEYQEDVRGPAEQLDVVAGSLTVLGQPVQTDARTVLDLTGGASLADLAAGERIEVSGFRTPSGVLRASYLGAAGPAAPLEVTARITAVDLNAQTFELGGQLIDYSQVLLLDLPAGMPELGIVVEAEGASLTPGGALIAERIRALPGEPGVFGSRDTDAAGASVAMISRPESSAFDANFLGIIATANLPSGIVIGDVQVTITAATAVLGGIADDLQPGRLVQVEGGVSSFGVIQADRIELL